MLVPKCIYPKCIFAKCTRLVCLLSFVSLFTLSVSVESLCLVAADGAGLVLSSGAGKRLWHLFEGWQLGTPLQSLLRGNADGIFCQKCKICLLACASACC